MDHLPNSYEVLLTTSLGLANSINVRNPQYWTDTIKNTAEKMRDPYLNMDWLVTAYCNYLQQLDNGLKMILDLPKSGLHPLDRPPMPILLNLSDAISTLLRDSGDTVICHIIGRFYEPPKESICRLRLVKILLGSGSKLADQFFENLQPLDVLASLVAERTYEESLPLPRLDSEIEHSQIGMDDAVKYIVDAKARHYGHQHKAHRKEIHESG